MKYKFETAGIIAGTLSSEAIFMSLEPISKYDQIGYEAKGLGVAVAGLVLSGLAVYLDSIVKPQTALAEDIDSPGGD